MWVRVCMCAHIRVHVSVTIICACMSGHIGCVRECARGRVRVECMGHVFTRARVRYLYPHLSGGVVLIAQKLQIEIIRKAQHERNTPQMPKSVTLLNKLRTRDRIHPFLGKRRNIKNIQLDFATYLR